MDHAVYVRQNLRRQFTKEDSHRPFDFYSKTASLLFTVQLISAHDPSAQRITKVLGTFKLQSYPEYLQGHSNWRLNSDSDPGIVGELYYL